MVEMLESLMRTPVVRPSSSLCSSNSISTNVAESSQDAKTEINGVTGLTDESSLKINDSSLSSVKNLKSSKYFKIWKSRYEGESLLFRYILNLPNLLIFQQIIKKICQ